MIRLESRNGVQVITEICDTCQCHIQNLTIDDIMVKPPELASLTVKDTQGNEVTRTKPRSKCYCSNCNH